MVAPWVCISGPMPLANFDCRVLACNATPSETKLDWVRIRALARASSRDWYSNPDRIAPPGCEGRALEAGKLVSCCANQDGGVLDTCEGASNASHRCNDKWSIGTVKRIGMHMEDSYELPVLPYSLVAFVFGPVLSRMTAAGHTRAILRAILRAIILCDIIVMSTFSVNTGSGEQAPRPLFALCTQLPRTVPFALFAGWLTPPTAEGRAAVSGRLVTQKGTCRTVCSLVPKMFGTSKLVLSLACPSDANAHLLSHALVSRLIHASDARGPLPRAPRLLW
ncbi:hypothetical protein BKA63DRAFT_495451 [Paraphoma chrysanthemicola]|nr:hypothetical protein BKA63DRAFT_495451 [Paraphoma chrysanthemicola]